MLYQVRHHNMNYHTRVVIILITPSHHHSSHPICYRPVAASLRVTCSGTKPRHVVVMAHAPPLVLAAGHTCFKQTCGGPIASKVCFLFYGIVVFFIILCVLQ